MAPLKIDGSYVNSSKDKAESLNHQFQSVFTCENLSDMSDYIDTPTPTMPDIAISVNGVQSLPESLDVTKASGPDNIPTHVLNFCASEIAPVLTIIFSQSLSTSQIPRDWLAANITAVFKKGY